MSRTVTFALAALAALSLAPAEASARDVPIARRMPSWAYVDLHSVARPVLVPAGLAFAPIGRRYGHLAGRARLRHGRGGCHVLSRERYGLRRHLVGLWSVYRCD